MRRRRGLGAAVGEYTPSRDELWVSAGIFSLGFLLFTLMVKVATRIMLGEFHAGAAWARSAPAASKS
ncbi:MAG: hypothetical protein EXS08_16785 [Planctomycetes bacterium]|nr:hypothetical protein [Planctomycetota bacterium]